MDLKWARCGSSSRACGSVLGGANLYRSLCGSVVGGAAVLAVKYDSVLGGADLYMYVAL